MTGCRVRKTVFGAFVLLSTLFCDLRFPSTTLWRARACLCNTKRDDSPPRRRSKAKEKVKEPDTREERKKQTNKRTDQGERKKKREQSDCERAAPHPGSRVSDRYHHSVGKNQSPGALLLLLLVLCFGAPCHP